MKGAAVATYDRLLAVFFALTFVATVVLTLYAGLDAAPAIAEAFRNEDRFDATESGMYKYVYVCLSGVFTLVLYMGVMHHIED